MILKSVSHRNNISWSPHVRSEVKSRIVYAIFLSSKCNTVNNGGTAHLKQAVGTNKREKKKKKEKKEKKSAITANLQKL